MAAERKQPKRQNRAVLAGEAASSALDPVFRKRGFASRDLLAQWRTIAPAPYDHTTMPERLMWPRKEAGAEGAILFLRVKPGHGMGIAYEGQLIAAAINRYFGYVLVGAVKLSAEPFVPDEARPGAPRKPVPSAEKARKVDDAVAGVEDEMLKEALRAWGHGITGKGDK